jgi:hypothetical protein
MKKKKIKTKKTIKTSKKNNKKKNNIADHTTEEIKALSWID